MKLLKPVVQLEQTGCGIASAAAVAGLSYPKAKAVASSLGISAADQKLWSDTAHVRRLLKHLGVRTAAGEHPFRSWSSLPDLALLAIKWHLEKGRPFWHWVVFVRDECGERVFDPQKTLRSNVRTDFGRMKPKWFIPVLGRGGSFDYSRDFSRVDFRERPELYQVGKGEQGVLLVEPYKSEILPHWRFKTPAIARKSAARIYRLYRDYRADKDFVGMDMARKFLQMGYTRARRYANHKSGRKYEAGRKVLPRVEDKEKAQSAAIFYKTWQRVREDRTYERLREAHLARTVAGGGVKVPE